MSFAPALLQGLGTLVSVVGAISQGRAANAAARYNATVNDQNAALARQEAADQATQQRRESYLRMGAIRAAQGHAGGDAGAGSVLDIIGDAAAQDELEQQNIAYRGALKARGFENTAALDRYSGAAAVRSSYLKAGSELLTGGARTYQLWKRT